jgi:hypothetical protein
MNAAVLFLAAFAPGADPVTLVQYPYPGYVSGAPAMPMYAPSPYAAGGFSDPNTGALPERRQRFSRLRAFFSRRSQDNDQANQDAPPANQRYGNGMPGVTRGAVVNPEMVNPEIAGYPETFTPIEGTPVIRPERATTTAPKSGPAIAPERITVPPTPSTVPTQKMPAGEPF